MNQYNINNMNETSVELNDKPVLLIIEDEYSSRFYMQQIFKNNFNVLLAKNGREGTEIALDKLPDIIVSDVIMPDMNGFECCEILKNDPRTTHIPIILLTALADEINTVTGLEKGADAYLTKPIRPNIIRAQVDQILNSRKKLKEIYAESPKEATQLSFVDSIDNPFVSNAYRIVVENINDNGFGVSKLSELLNMSQPTLYRKIKLFTDLSIADFIKKIKIEYSSILLKSNLYSVQEVANMVGYVDIPTFRKHFADTYGCTPSKYMTKKD